MGKDWTCVLANVMFENVLVGLFTGWVLLAPLGLGWGDIFEQENQ